LFAYHKQASNRFILENTRTGCSSLLRWISRLEKQSTCFNSSFLMVDEIEIHCAKGVLALASSNDEDKTPAEVLDPKSTQTDNTALQKKLKESEASNA
jgi:hypothetical protein